MLKDFTSRTTLARNKKEGPPGKRETHTSWKI